VSSDRHAKVKELFLAACERAPEERSGFLNDACAGDAGLRAEVEELMAFHETGTRSEILDHGALEDLESIAGHRIIQKVGEGGMGEVYEAEQVEPVRRRVALKVIKWGMDTKEVLARFSSERQALALMNHPNIARVYEAGATSSGRPYFAMEYVKGVPITDYCDTHRLTTDERLELFYRVCEGVQHAHQRGVIHRDMKPSNVLVMIQDDRAVPKIIDFGVAKATSQRLTERTVFTELGQWIGTPEYMSPEQAEMTGLDIDTRTDVYSLGVVLYELLSGAQPLDPTTLRSGGFDEMRRRIREEEPPRPSTRVSSLGDDSVPAARLRRTDRAGLVRELQGDLDWIVMKALEKDRTRRYATPMELAEDVRRHLAHQPVEASPPSTAYRLGKFVRRNRVAVAAAATVVAALILGIVGTTIGLVRAQQEARAARQVVRLLSDIFGGMHPARQTGHAPSVEEILDRGVRTINHELGEQPLVEAELKNIIGSVYMGMGDYDRAGRLLEEALFIRRELIGEDLPPVADSLRTLGAHRFNTGRYDEARSLYEQALDIYERRLSPDHEAVGLLLGEMCFLDWRLNEHQRGVETCERAEGIIEKAYGGDSLEMANLLFRKAIVIRDTYDSERAAVLARRSLEIRERILGPDNTDVGWSLHDLGMDYLNLGDRESAREYLERALEIQEAALGPDSNAVSMPLQRLAGIHRTEGDLEGARQMYQRALDIRQRALGPDHPDNAWILVPYAHFLRSEGEVERAQRMIEKAVAITDKSYGTAHLEYGWSVRALGYHEYALGNFEEAIRLNQTCLEIERAVLGPNARRSGWSLYNLSCISALLSRREEAIEYFRRMLDTGWWWTGIPEDTDLESLRGDPEFEELMDEVRKRISQGRSLAARQ
jgi:non-specific serine/threonine protein kinase/serine/threonine-protein kinase